MNTNDVMQEKRVDITGLDKAAVLAALYNRSQPLGAGWLRERGAEMTRDEAAELLAGKDSGDYPLPRQQSASFDYLYGRVMKVNLTRDDSFDPWGYDRDNGQGAAQAAVDAVRAAARAEAGPRE